MKSFQAATILAASCCVRNLRSLALHLHLHLNFHLTLSLSLKVTLTLDHTYSAKRCANTKLNLTSATFKGLPIGVRRGLVQPASTDWTKPVQSYMRLPH